MYCRPLGGDDRSELPQGQLLELPAAAAPQRRNNAAWLNPLATNHTATAPEAELSVTGGTLSRIAAWMTSPCGVGRWALGYWVRDKGKGKGKGREGKGKERKGKERKGKA